jgi:two-component system chemotaxis response regulator CheB
MINQTAPLAAPGFRTAPASPGNRKIRILIVDDSVVIRRFITNALEQEPTFEVVGSAVNGLLAVQKAAELKPDVITLDIEMPEMDGIATVKKLREMACSAYVIMCSTLTSRGASATIDALMMGANDYVTKPSNSGPMDSALVMLRDELIPKIKQFFEEKRRSASPRRPSSPQLRPPVSLASSPSASSSPRQVLVPSFLSQQERKILAIGVSTGGPTALMEILPMFPPTFPLPIVIVQHMPPLFTKLLADRLRAQCSLEVVEATAGMALKPGRAVIAPGDFHMRLRRAANEVSVALDQAPRENSCRPAVDVLFRSVAELYAGGVIGVILTGMGQDGLRGVEQLKQKGAYIIAQDQSTSVVWGMPGAIVDAGLADTVLALRSVVPEILKQVSR